MATAAPAGHATDTRADTAAVPNTAYQTDPAEVLERRFKAWRSLISDLESYFTHLEKAHENAAKEYAKVAKAIDTPFKKEQQTFDQGGIRDIFSALSGHATKLSNDQHTYSSQTESTLVKGCKKLDSDIKDFVKRLDKDGVKGGKTVSKLTTDTEKHITLLGTHIGKAQSGNVKPSEDPYVTHRGILHRISNQVEEENEHQATLLQLQQECGQFEAQIVQTIQGLVSQMSSQAQAEASALQSTHNQLNSSVSGVNSQAVWSSFVSRGGLADATQKRQASALEFPGKNDKMTKSVIEGDLYRKGTVLKKYNAAYYVVTPAGYLHEFKSKSHESDPDPEWSIDLSQCALGAHSSPQSGKFKFTLSGKTKGLMSQKHDYKFQATSYDDLVTWWTHIKKYAGSSPNVEEAVDGEESDSEVASPTAAHGAAAAVPATAAAGAAGHQQPLSSAAATPVGAGATASQPGHSLAGAGTDNTAAPGTAYTHPVATTAATANPATTTAAAHDIDSHVSGATYPTHGAAH